MKFIVAFGSVRTNRRGIKAARFALNQLQARGHQTVFFDALELKLPLLDRMFKEYPEGEAPETMVMMAREIRSADGVVVVSGEYNHSIQPGLANMLDHFLEEWFWKPSAIISYSAGVTGGGRAAVHLRAVLAELGMSSIPSILSIARIGDAIDESGKASDPKLESRARRFFDEFEWYARAIAVARAGGVPS